jgi:hypothetical protein
VNARIRICNCFAIALFAAVLAFTDRHLSLAQTEQRNKPAPARPRILAHYLPWYEAKPFRQVWGWHWTMGAFDPEKSQSKTDRPGIASHYHPLIGPYDSGDPDVLEYHALLMKLAGIDGVVVDWYGTVDYLDYASIHRHVSALADVATRIGLEFAVCYEDQTVPKLVASGRIPATERVQHARNEIDRIRSSWFAKPTYLKVDGRPVLLSFGQDGLTEAEWTQALAAGKEGILYLSEHKRRAAAAGAFDWPVPPDGVKAQDALLREAGKWPVAMAVAYPRFHDIYEQAGLHKSYGRINDDGGKTFVLTFEKALASKLPLIQICTWNDWGEGTMIEPSVEFGYRDLEVIQRLRRQLIDPSFAAQHGDLRLPRRLYRLRKDARRVRVPVGRLDQVARLLSQRSGGAARLALDGIERDQDGAR